MMNSDLFVIRLINEFIKSNTKILHLLTFKVILKQNYVIVPLNQIKDFKKRRSTWVILQEAKTNLDGYSEARFNEAAIYY